MSARYRIRVLLRTVSRPPPAALILTTKPARRESTSQLKVRRRLPLHDGRPTGGQVEYAVCMLNERLQILIRPDQRRRLEAEARRRGTSVAALVREAVDSRFGPVP